MMPRMLPFAGIFLLASSAVAQSEPTGPGNGRPSQAAGTEAAPVEPTGEAAPAEGADEVEPNAATGAESPAEAPVAEPESETSAQQAAEPANEIPATEATAAEATPAKPATEATATEATPARPATEATAAEATPAETTAASSDEPTEVVATVKPPAEAIDRGFIYFGFGLGIGASGLSDKSLGDTPLAGTLNLRAGVILFDRLLIGAHGVFLGQFYKWEAQSITGAVLSSLMAEGMYFPIADLPLNVSAGFGWGSAAKLVRVADTRDGDPKVVASSGNGVSWMAGVGWDLAPGPGANFGIQARYEGTQSSGFGVDHGAFLGLWLNFY